MWILINQFEKGDKVGHLLHSPVAVKANLAGDHVARLLQVGPHCVDYVRLGQLASLSSDENFIEQIPNLWAQTSIEFALTSWQQSSINSSEMSPIVCPGWSRR
jgi:hypothetical protein